MAKKRVAAVVKIQIPAGAATPAPPVGTALGPHGVALVGDREPRSLAVRRHQELHAGLDVLVVETLSGDVEEVIAAGRVEIEFDRIGQGKFAQRVDLVREKFVEQKIIFFDVMRQHYQ